MRRPTSDVRQRETRRSTALETNPTRRRNSSVPFSNVRLDKNRFSQDSETDFLCDRAVEFMDSGDICSIVAVELAEQSVYFERLLRYHRGRGCIRLPEFLNAGFASVIEYIRRGSTNITPENIYEIFITADYLLVSKLKQECSKFIGQFANDPSTAINLWVTGRPLYWPEVGNMAFQKILQNFENVSLSQEFIQLEAEDVELIIKDDSLNCKSEMTVFDAIMRWLAESPDTRTKSTLKLLWNLRLGMVRQNDIVNMKLNEHITLVEDYLKILNEWPNSIYELMTRVNDDQKITLTKPRTPHEVLCVFGGWCDGEGPRAAAQIFNPCANSWTLWTDLGCQTQSPLYEWLDHLSPDGSKSLMDITGPEGANRKTPTERSSPLSNKLIPTLPDGLYRASEQLINASDISCLIGEIPRRVYAGCVLVGNRVYLVGGFDGTNALKSTLCYDFELDSGWYEISCMYEKRYYVSVAFAARYIYALGGHNGENQGRLDTAERYNLDENLWQPIASMNRIRSDAAAAELNDRVYVAGGFEGRRYHDSAEYYDAEMNQWTLVSRMHSPRGGISLAAHGGYIYAIGGNDGNSRLRSIERFDPEQGKWELIGQMNRRKSNLSSTVLGDDIYIIGGWSDEPEAGILSLVERFDTKTRECLEIRALTFPASATCACTLRNRDLVKKFIQPKPLAKQAKPMKTEDDLRVNQKIGDSTSSSTPVANQTLTPTEQMGMSGNNLELENTTTLTRNTCVNNLFFDEVSEIHPLNHPSVMDCLNETSFDSDLEPSYSSSSELSQNEATICEIEIPSTSQMLPPLPPRPPANEELPSAVLHIHQLTDQNHNNSRRDWFNPRITQPPPHIPEFSVRIPAPEIRRRNLRSSRRQPH